MADHIITRRDFLNGTLLAAGGASGRRVFSDVGIRPATARPRAFPCGDGVRLDPRMARGGNLPAAFRPAHWLIAQRLRFDKDSVDLLPGDDEWSGKFAVESEGDQYDAVVVGSGLSGLAAAFYLSKQHPNAQILILEANSAFGGNAGRDEGYPLAMPASTAGSYIAAPEDGKLYRSLGIDWERYVLPSPANTFFFDDHTPYALRGARRWVLDAFGRGIDEMPYPPNILADMKGARRDFVAWYKQAGGPTDPSDDSDPRFDYLDRMTLHDYLTKDKGFHPAVSDFLLGLFRRRPGRDHQAGERTRRNFLPLHPNIIRSSRFRAEQTASPAVLFAPWFPARSRERRRKSGCPARCSPPLWTVPTVVCASNSTPSRSAPIPRAMTPASPTSMTSASGECRPRPWCWPGRATPPGG